MWTEAIVRVSRLGESVMLNCKITNRKKRGPQGCAVQSEVKVIYPNKHALYGRHGLVASYLSNNITFIKVLFASVAENFAYKTSCVSRILMARNEKIEIETQNISSGQCYEEIR